MVPVNPRQSPVTPGPEPVQLGTRTVSVRPGGHACPASGLQHGGLAAIGLEQGHLAAIPGTPAAPRAAVPGPVVRDDGRVALVVAPLLGELTTVQARLLAVLVAGASLVQCRNADPAALDRRAAAEKVTVRLE